MENLTAAAKKIEKETREVSEEISPLCTAVVNRCTAGVAEKVVYREVVELT